MAACSSQVDTTVFMRWRPSSPPAEQVSDGKSRRDQMRQFGATEPERQRELAAGRKPKQSSRKAKTGSGSGGGAGPAAVGASPAPAIVRLGHQKTQQAPEGPEAAATPRTLKHLRLLTPGTRANRWMHSTWHHLPPNPDTSRGNCRASHFAAKPGGSGADCGHYRIHPDWGWDAPLPPSQ